MDESVAIKLMVVRLLKYIANHVSHNDIDELLENISEETQIGIDILNYYYEE